MSSVTPSPQQAAAIADILEWYRHRRGQQQVFRLFGYAGTGKSTITAAAIEALGLRPMTRDASFAGACSLRPSPARPRS
ncbi:hypothetical protein ACI6QG_14790 [Roseococcus sp. DSY-14]|uniref:hypothetical protein n=1 Tax=Roseococcus sp. DSY-14 TaxID=3369650 RepID=UPI00387B09F6